MSTSHVKGNALDWAEKDGYCMLHVCNAQGKMGSGIAKQVKERFPSAFKRYEGYHPLGSITWSDDRKIVNLVAQEFYGYDNKRYLNYGALAECLSSFINNSEFHKHPCVVVPFKMGSDRAGGDWEIVLEMVEYLISPVFDILVVEYES